VTRRALWLVGDARIAASPSPLLHDAVFGPGTYTLHAEADADAAFAAAERTCRGINVTAPHKVAAARRYEAVVDDRARACGAVNTVVFDDDGQAVRASNTDVIGLLVAWRRAAFSLEGRRVAVVGAGGAARAVVVAAAEAGVVGVVVHARRRDAAAAMVALASSSGLDAIAAPTANDDDHDGERDLRADVVVIAASELDDPQRVLARALMPAGVVHDLRYGSRAVGVRDAALRRGARFADGTTMLLAQAEAAAALFRGAPLDVAQQTAMREAMAGWLRQARG
jgi:shikimate dehydrogenase